MGYAQVVWVREHAIREYLTANGKDKPLMQEVGRRVLELTSQDSFERNRSRWNSPLPLFDVPSVFFPFRSFHASDSAILIWTGNRLQQLSVESSAMFDCLHKLSDAIGASHVVTPIPRNEYRRAVAGRRWDNQLQQSMYASVYWIYEDFSREFARQSQSEWPCEEVGNATLELMLSDWSRSRPVRNHGNAISRACSFRQPEFTVLVWSGNCLRLLTQVEENEIQRIRESLAEG